MEKMKKICENETLEVLELPYPIVLHLRRAGVHTVGQFKQLTTSEMLKIRNIGIKSCEKIVEVQKELGGEVDEKALENLKEPKSQRKAYKKAKQPTDLTCKDEDKLEELKLPNSIFLLLRRAGVKTVGEFKKMTSEELMAIRGIGTAYLIEIRKVQKRLNS